MKEVSEHEITIIFGSRIRALRTARGISQEELALASNLDRTYIGGIERGERNLSLVNIEKISRALEVSLSDIFRSI